MVAILHAIKQKIPSPRLLPRFVSIHAGPGTPIHTEKLHAGLLKSGILLHKSTVLKLVQLYCRSECFRDANYVFNEMLDWDLVSCTSIIGIFSQFGRGKDAFYIFSRMLACDIKPNEFTFGTLLHLCTRLHILNVGEQLHSASVKMGLDSNVFVGSALVDLYAKFGTMEDATKAFADILEPNIVSHTSLIVGYLKNGSVDDAVNVFNDMPGRNVVSWNAMISGCSQRGQNEKALDLFVEMCQNSEKPNISTFASVISAVGNIAAIGIGRHLHAFVIKSLRKLDVFVGNSLVTCYAKCGAMEESRQLFDSMHERNIVSWNALISGYAQNGRAKEALYVFKEMKAVDGPRPNGVTILCLLFACNHAGLVDEGCELFDQVRQERPEILQVEHYACVVDLLSRSGRFKEAETFLQKLPFDPGIGFWKALLGGCVIHSNIRMAELAARQLLAMDPGDASSYVLLSNVYAAADRWHAVSKMRKVMYEKGMKRTPGCSWIEIGNKVFTFVTVDKRHPQTDEIYAILRCCYQHLEEAGYSPCIVYKLHSYLE